MLNKLKIIKCLCSCADNRVICRTSFRYSEYNHNYFPLKVSDKFFMGIKEDDFILDGYTVRRVKDIKKAEYKDDFTLHIMRKEGISENIEIPDVKLKNWKTIFRSLRKMNRNIIIEKEELDAFYIGRIEEVYSDHLIFRHFDGDGNWLSRPYRIFYEHITSVTWGSRYVDIFSKYIGEPPAEKEEHEV